MRLNSTFILLLLLICIEAWSQTQPTRGDFMFPVRPQQENYLSGTMGELRSSHFHSGLDIKTSGITGLPVYAAADGYVQRVRVSQSGYGNAIYLVHPHNSTVTVYAHLKSFQDDIAKYVRAKQYEKQSFQVDLYPDKSQFAFKKGDVIALSGNSGSSSGPHLHFEIRTLKHRALDPLQYGFDEIKDEMPPVLGQVAFVTMDQNSRVNGMFGRVEFDVELKENGDVVIPEGIALFGNIGVEVYAYDKFDGARNRNGVSFQSLLLDGRTVFSQKIEQINFSGQRNILAHTNYKRSREGGRRFNKLYVDAGNQLDFYETNIQSGVLQINDPLEHQLEIRLEDAYGNINHINFKVNDKEFERNRELKHTYGLDDRGYDVFGNYLELETDKGYCTTELYLEGDKHKLDLTYYTNTSYHYLWDLRKGLPDSARICDRFYKFNFAALLPSEIKYSWQSERIAISTSKNALFDSVYLEYKYYRDLSDREIFELNNRTSPLRQFITINLKPEQNYDITNSAVYGIDQKGKLNYVGGEWEGEEIVFKSRDLVPYTIATDSVAPVIKSQKYRNGRLEFRVEDKMSGLKSFEATLNDRWLLMHIDAKRGFLWSDELVEIKGKFVLTLTDNASNVDRFEAEF